jgi:hypothetical protein
MKQIRKRLQFLAFVQAYKAWRAELSIFSVHFPGDFFEVGDGVSELFLQFVEVSERFDCLSPDFSGNAVSETMDDGQIGTPVALSDLQVHAATPFSLSAMG